jgi:flavin reductase (DIM6/NTAB) family NADH-FMN oxidoreductase RutF
MQIDLSTLKPGHVYGLLTQLLIPRPIAWVLSDNGNGEFNLAPFSYFTGISSNPPLLMISIGKKKGGSSKDTLANIENRDDFVVHIPSTNHQGDVTASADSLPVGESEVIKQGLELSDMTDFQLPRLKDCQIAFACSKHQIIRLDGVAQSMVIGRVKSVYIADEVVTVTENDRMIVSATGVDPLCRLGSTEYGNIGKVISG